MMFYLDDGWLKLSARYLPSKPLSAESTPFDNMDWLSRDLLLNCSINSLYTYLSSIWMMKHMQSPATGFSLLEVLNSWDVPAVSLFPCAHVNLGSLGVAYGNLKKYKTV
jgi:hypothetical protein